LEQTTNQRSQKFRTIQSLIDQGIIHESERELYNLPNGFQDYPTRQITQFIRIKKADGTEWFKTSEHFTGITETGAVENATIDIHTHVIPTVIRELRDQQGQPLQLGANVINSRTMQASIIKMDGSRELVGTIGYLTPWNKEVFKSAMKFARGQIGDNYNGSSLTLKKENFPGKVGVPDVDEYMNMDFDELYKRYGVRPQSSTLLNAGPGVVPYK
jgi:hypothetical protein